MASNTPYRINVVSRGSLDDITKRPSNSSRPGSKASLNGNSARTSAAKARRKPESATSLEFLSKEEIMREDFDLEIEEYGSSDCSSDDDGNDVDLGTGRTSEMFGIAEPLSNRQRQVALLPDPSEADDDELLLTRSLLGYDDESEVDVDSEEERDIIRDIRAEITNQVKEEMAGELAIYREAKARLKTPAEDVEEDEMDPELKEALYKMRKLDRILAKKIKKEKAVKRDRILLERKLHEELMSIKRDDGKVDAKEVAVNTQKFLALTLPPSHNAAILLDLEREGSMALSEVTPSDVSALSRGDTESYLNWDFPLHEGVKFLDYEPTPPVTPVFPTQVLEESLARERRHMQKTRSGSTSDQGSTVGDASEQSETISMSGSADSRRRKKRNKDFIKRNMQLAADAGNAIAMTDDEKKRIEDLLGDLEALPEVPEDTDIAIDSNPYQIVLSAGEGFLPSGDEQKRLTNIDQRLRALLPPEDFQSIASTPRSFAPKQSILFTRTTLHSDTEGDECGEDVLQETKEHRDQKQRLFDIEYELDRLSSAVEMEIQSPTLSNYQLEELLDQCARTMSRATAETDSLSQSGSVLSVPSSRQSLLENPPKLPPDVLQQLLEEARQSHGMNAGTAIDGNHSDQESLLESVGEDKIRELLLDSRATSRASLRSVSDVSTTVSRHENGNLSNGEIMSMDTENRLAEMSKYEEEFNSARAMSRGALGFDLSGELTDTTSWGVNGATGPVPGSDELMNVQSARFNELLNNVRLDLSESEDRQPFLPKIDHSGQLSTQRQGGYRLNNEDLARPNNSARGSANVLRNNISDNSSAVMDTAQSGNTTPTPRPPSGTRTNSGGRHRSLANFSRNSFD